MTEKLLISGNYAELYPDKNERGALHSAIFVSHFAHHVGHFCRICCSASYQNSAQLCVYMYAGHASTEHCLPRGCVSCAYILIRLCIATVALPLRSMALSVLEGGGQTLKGHSTTVCGFGENPAVRSNRYRSHNRVID